MDFTTRNSQLLLEKSMDYLWAKQNAIADNIVNAETPGYRAKVVTFEETLRSRLERAEMANAPAGKMKEVLQHTNYRVRVQPEVTRVDDNGVNVTEQNIELMRNAYQLQYAMSAINSELSVLRMAARGQ